MLREHVLEFMEISLPEIGGEFRKIEGNAGLNVLQNPPCWFRKIRRIQIKHSHSVDIKGNCQHLEGECNGDRRKRSEDDCNGQSYWQILHSAGVCDGNILCFIKQPAAREVSKGKVAGRLQPLMQIKGGEVRDF